MIHKLVQILYSREAKRFEKSLASPEATQRKRLSEILISCGQETETYEAFVKKYPISQYEDWSTRIEKQKTSGKPDLNQKVVRYEPTSGSQSQRKWIPYTPHFLKEINSAAQTWIHDLYSTHARLRGGQHFWSLSWIPKELRGTLQTDDSQLFPAYQRFFIDRFLSRHPAIQYASTAESAWWATKLHLVSLQDLRFISIWSPSYLLSAIEEIFEERALIAEVFANKKWMKFESELSNFFVPERTSVSLKNLKSCESVEAVIAVLWPKLFMISCWDSASSHELALVLRSLFPQVKIQSKGLWATEGVVTFPWREKHPLAIRSHFYEFRDLANGEIFPAWKLKIGQEVQPILTTGTGMLRYELPDRTLVSGMIENTPTLEFLGRMGSVDLVGEKLGFEDADAILEALREEFPATHFYCLTASLIKQKARYHVLAVGTEDPILVSQKLEEKLTKFHHYSVARELSQIEPAECILFHEINALLLHVEKNQVRGQNKLNSIMRMS